MKALGISRIVFITIQAKTTHLSVIAFSYIAPGKIAIMCLTHINLAKIHKGVVHVVRKY